MGGGTLLSGCERVISEATERFGQTIPEKIAVPNSKEVDPIFHLLSRAGYGPWPGDLELVRKQGAKAWVEEQLNPTAIDDQLCELRARRFESIYLKPGDCYDFKKNVLRDDITRFTLLRAIYSKRQLYEVMVGFWSDHLNINLEKGDCIFLKADDDRSVVRAHALGNFKDMIRASAVSPAMLVYLDGKENKRGVPSDVPNENYARELMELHTLGVNGGYTQKDVYEAARCLTGWRLRTEWAKGTVFFEPSLHDDGQKVVLGQVITAGGGEQDLDRLVDIVVNHPSTAKYVAGKLVRFFVSDDPPAALVEAAARQFSAGKGEIKPVVKTILLSQEFQESRGNKFKRPFRYIVSALRATAADTHARQGLIEYLSRMGQGPFQYPTPDGYPEEMMPWLGTLLWRWNFALALASNELPAVTVSTDRLIEAMKSDKEKFLTADLMVRHFTGRKITNEELRVLQKFQTSPVELIGLIVSSPAFQRF